MQKEVLDKYNAAWATGKVDEVANWYDEAAVFLDINKNPPEPSFGKASELRLDFLLPLPATFF